MTIYLVSGSGGIRGVGNSIQNLEAANQGETAGCLPKAG
jgi:hypothetical protein